MKRCAAILLLALVLYNAFGYYALFAYERAQARVIALQDMPESAFQVLKFNLAIYTSVENTDFEYVNDEIVADGKTYNIVKKRIQNDTLHMYYLRNYKQDALRESLHEVVASQVYNDHDNDTQPVKQLLKTFLKDYCPEGSSLLLLPSNCFPTEGVALNAMYKNLKGSNHHILHAPPPEGC